MFLIILIFNLLVELKLLNGNSFICKFKDILSITISEYKTYLELESSNKLQELSTDEGEFLYNQWELYCKKYG